MDEVPDITRPVSRIRSIAGLVILGLSALVFLRMIWLVDTYGAEFGDQEWIRFAFGIWIALVLFLTGFWVRYRSRAAGWTAFIVGPVLLGCFYLAARLGF